jgi:hypothetical protein
LERNIIRHATTGTFTLYPLSRFQLKDHVNLWIQTADVLSDPVADHALCLPSTVTPGALALGQIADRR